MTTQERLKDLLDYDPDTGVFRWRPDLNRNGIRSGYVAGYRRKDRYVCVRVDGKSYLAHRLAFIWMTGKCPELIDHINHDPSDNRWKNLRPATHAQNMRNMRSRTGSSSKYLGVSWGKASGKWRSEIKVDGNSKHLGLFANEAEAAKAYDEAAKKHFGEFANLNFGGQ